MSNGLNNLYFGEIKMPTGNERGANEMWIPGGKTSGGTTEAVLVGSDKVVHNGKWDTFISFFDNVEPIK